MALRKKKSGAIINKSEVRLSAMEQIDTEKNTTINYGGKTNPLTAADFSDQIEVCEDRIKEYNQFLEQADAKGNRIKAEEKKLSAMYARVLKGAVGEFGADADEIEKLGGTRSSERKRPARKTGDAIA